MPTNGYSPNKQSVLQRVIAIKKIMKNLFYPFLFVAALAIQSCGGNSSDNSAAADSTNMADDTTMMNDNATQQVSAVDTAFASKAAVSGMAEVELGQLALEKASNAKVKEFASMMVNDHGKANSELESIANAKMIVLPTALDAEHAKIKADLSAKSGADFDKAYAKAMVDGHRKTLTLMEDGGKNNQDSELKAFAEKTAPVVKHHLEMITKIQASL